MSLHNAHWMATILRAIMKLYCVIVLLLLIGVDGASAPAALFFKHWISRAEQHLSRLPKEPRYAHFNASALLTSCIYHFTFNVGTSAFVSECQQAHTCFPSAFQR